MFTMQVACLVDITHDINIWMALKDFSILLEKVNVTNTKKDIGMVSGFNAYAQYIENICKTQKGELVGDVTLGSDYYSYIFSGQADLGVLQNALAAYIDAAVPNISKVSVVVNSFTETSIQFTVFYSVSNGINNQANASTFIEVEI